MKKVLFYSLLACIFVTFTACSTKVDRTREAFETGILQIGSSYDEVVDVLGKPMKTAEFGDDTLCMYATFLTINLGDAICAIIFQQDDYGILRVSQFLAGPNEIANYHAARK